MRDRYGLSRGDNEPWELQSICFVQHLLKCGRPFVRIGYKTGGAFIFFETIILKNLTTMIILLVICVMIWVVWGIMFDPEPNLGPVERAIKHPGRWSRKVMRGWIEDAKEVISDPDSTEEDREKAMKDIEFFSKYIGEEELMNLRKRA
jgi:hypothetical protein